MKVAILTNGSYGNYEFCNDICTNDYIICADNGIKHAKLLGITPNILIGDFDSANQEDFNYFVHQKNIEVVKLPSEKDETDTELALQYAIEHGATNITIYGGLGHRFDHSLANVHLLYQALTAKVECCLKNEFNTIYLINKEICISGKIGQLISLLPFTENVLGVYTKGLAYSLENGQFTLGKPYGISNYMTENLAQIKIDSGLLLVMKTKD
ncbi:MAG: thiamine diphosphokinase [Epulopiscium sp. Nele67-Bin005]|nr:MAG: thiamine diphosphokinase [Epulopiscium sp. Nele67-Bin005]